MKKIILTLFIASWFTGAIAQTKKAAPAKPVESKPRAASTNEVAPAKDPKDMEKIWMEYMTPGEEHAKLAAAEGEWKEEIKTWMHPDAEPTSSVATCTIRMILEGRYQESIHQGDFNGMPFHGQGITGYDNALKKYVSTWIDNMGTGVIFSTGTFNAKLGGIEFFGEQADPVTGKLMKVREVYTVKSDGEHFMEMYNTPAGGKEFKSMEIRMTR
ncbi:MAG: DUF1579 domain-containing protein [Bacteroidetes bacterium]|jgi:hypothetical protein|nr:DUF1579 domain-containing protein [Bacteroidota bacterium]